MLSRCLALCVLIAAAGGVAIGAGPAGRYRMVGEPDVASEIILHADGRFQYFLSAGALDEHAEGRWTREGNAIRLTTVPTPRPAVFSAGAIERNADAPFTILVTWPDGRGIAGVDFILRFDSGEPAGSYTQEYGWMLDPTDKRRPMSVSFAVPMHGVQSQTFPIDAAKGNRFTFVLTPNDLGTVDFRGVTLTVDRQILILHRNGANVTYKAEPRR